MADDDPAIPTPCCACDAPGPHRNLMALEFTAPVEATGWGCVICGLPPNGAVAIMCDPCAEAGRMPLQVCHGYPLDGGRIAIADYTPEYFNHNPEIDHG